jgi:hypothetical protein
MTVGGIIRGLRKFFSLFQVVFRSEAAAAFSPRLQPRVGGKTQSNSLETATAMIFSTISTHCCRRFTASRSPSNDFPKAKAWGYLLPPLPGEIRAIMVPLNVVVIPVF